MDLLEENMLLKRMFNCADFENFLCEARQFDFESALEKLNTEELIKNRLIFTENAHFETKVSIQNDSVIFLYKTMGSAHFIAKNLGISTRSVIDVSIQGSSDGSDLCMIILLDRINDVDDDKPCIPRIVYDKSESDFDLIRDILSSANPCDRLAAYLDRCGVECHGIAIDEHSLIALDVVDSRQHLKNILHIPSNSIIQLHGMIYILLDRVHKD